MLNALRDRFEQALPLDTAVHVASVAVPFLLALLIGNVAISVAGRALARSGVKSDARVAPALYLLRWLLFVVVVILAVFTYAGSWKGFGVSLGVIVAAAGFALQRPAASVAAWMTILLKRPFRIGDRIEVGTLARGNVLAITFTHLYLEEVGRYGAEDVSGRRVMLPNSIIFDQPVVRYGGARDRILGEVEVTLSYDSDVAAAIPLLEGIAAEVAGAPAKPHTRAKLDPSGVRIELRYQVSVADANRVASDINLRILEAIRSRKDMAITYPVTEVRIAK